MNNDSMINSDDYDKLNMYNSTTGLLKMTKSEDMTE